MVLASSSSADSAGGKSDTSTLTLLQQPAQNSGIFEFDYGVPSSPALSLAGLTADKVPTSSTLKAFALSLPSVLESGGSGQSAALDIAPAAIILSPLDLNADNYRNQTSWWQRILIRTHLGVAASEGSDGGGTPSKAVNSKLAFAVSTSLFDYNDPLVGAGWTAQQACFDANSATINKYETARPQNLEKIGSIENLQRRMRNAGVTAGGPLTQADLDLVAEAQADLGLPVAAPAAGADREDVLTDYWNKLTAKSKELSDADKVDTETEARTLNVEQIFETCGKMGALAAAYSPALDFGLGAVWSGDDGKLQNLSNPAFAVWLGFRYPFGVILGGDPTKAGGDAGSQKLDPKGYWIVGGSFRYTDNTSVSTGNTATPHIQANVLDTWIGLERYSETTKFDAQIGYLDQEAVTASQSAFSQSGTRWLVSGAVEVLADAGVWVQGSYGNALGTAPKLDDRTFMLSLSFGPPKAANVFGISSGSTKPDGGT